MANRTVTTPPRPAAHEPPAALELPGCRRGLSVSAALPRRLAELESVSTEALVQAALECRDEQDLPRLVAYPR